MDYTAPAGNAADLNFAKAYAAPAGGAADLNFEEDVGPYMFLVW